MVQSKQELTSEKGFLLEAAGLCLYRSIYSVLCSKMRTVGSFMQLVKGCLISPACIFGHFND